MSRKAAEGRIILIAETLDGTVVEQYEVSYDDYYGGRIPVVDSNAYRVSKGIRRLKGEVYLSSGTLQQTFDNRYSDDGRYAGGRTVHDDGTVIED
ncbi:MAG: hypothetical protein ACYC4U_27500 [Pirellulaceae bacterium]